MQFRTSAPRRFTLASALLACVLLSSSCGRSSDPVIGTFHLGEKVQVKSTTYTALESEWKTALTEGGRAPQQRFLFVTVEAVNSGDSQASVPMFELMAADGTRHKEIAQEMEGVRNWLGIFRIVEPGQSARGVVVFDVPMAAYKLVIPDHSDLENEKYALVTIPVQIE